jgi:citrate lyase beta subunit
MSGQMKTFRSLLFVPGSRPERFAKAIAAGADAVCIDLEDAVPPQDKDSAREAVLSFIAQMPTDLPCAVGVRINPLDTVDGLKDLLAFKAAGVTSNYLMLPKAHATRDINIIQRLLAHEADHFKTVLIWAVIEDLQGLANASELAGFCGTRGGILFGGADFSASIGTSMAWEPLFYARSKLVVKTKVIQGGLMDVPFLDTKDDEGLRSEAQRVKALGFTGKACIHPNQVAIVNEVFSPSQSDIDWAKRVVQADIDQKGNAILLDGKLLDAPVYFRAHRILEQAGIEI